MPLNGGRAGHEVVPVERAGCYAPGGRFPLPSSVLMTAVDPRARRASRGWWVASPRPAQVTLAAAFVAGADALLAVGGAQAIGALAFGAGEVPACDAIVGPGNRWVTAAKQRVAGHVAIDMLAGPSELVVLADDTADPGVIAADLLAQAEHDTDALPVLVTMDATLPDRVRAELAIGSSRPCPPPTTAPRGPARGFAVVEPDVERAVAIVNELAPEHLQILLRDPGVAADRVRHAGALFLGPRSAEVLGDYGAGPNHVLPTSRGARSRAGLSVLTFLRVRTWLEMDEPAAPRPGSPPPAPGRPRAAPGAPPAGRPGAGGGAPARGEPRVAGGAGAWPAPPQPPRCEGPNLAPGGRRRGGRGGGGGARRARGAGARAPGSGARASPPAAGGGGGGRGARRRGDPGRASPPARLGSHPAPPLAPPPCRGLRAPLPPAPRPARPPPPPPPPPRATARWQY